MQVLTLIITGCSYQRIAQDYRRLVDGDDDVSTSLPSFSKPSHFLPSFTHGPCIPVMHYIDIVMVNVYVMTSVIAIINIGSIG
jgi:hypothetical protein